MMLAILIDPFTETIEVVDYSGDWQDISTLLGCSLFTTIDLGDSDTLYVDDEEEESLDSSRHEDPEP